MRQEVVIVPSFANISQETIEHDCLLALDFTLCCILFSHMASSADYRIHELTIVNQVAGIRTIVCDSDQMAIAKAKKMLDDRDLEIRHGARVVARLRRTDNE
jgi:hypothetical protein